MSSHLLVPAEVAKRLLLKRADRVYAMIAAGEIKASNIGTKSRPQWRIRESEVEALLDRREKTIVKTRSRLRANNNFDEVPDYV